MLQRIRVDSIVNEATLDTALPGVFEHFPDALILADGEACITYMNPAAEQMLGLALKKARGYALDKLLSLQDGETGQPIRIRDQHCANVIGRFQIRPRLRGLPA